MKHFKDDLLAAQAEINRMMVESQANAEAIQKMQDDAGDKQEEVEKLKLECQVVITEKYTVKKELDRVDHLYNKMRKDHNQQRIEYDLIVDEVTKTNKQNSHYRQLILENDSKLQMVQ